jgi:hypothetical protein
VRGSRPCAAVSPNIGPSIAADLRQLGITSPAELPGRVVLTIAPLWELVSWKEAKSYWEELLEGKYERSSMGKLLRKKGLVK